MLYNTLQLAYLTGKKKKFVFCLPRQVQYILYTCDLLKKSESYYKMAHHLTSPTTSFFCHFPNRNDTF